jgi:MFS family permease
LGAPEPFAQLPRGLAPLGYRDFALYWIGLISTNTGRWVELTGLVWLVYELTDSPLLVGLLGTARALPALILSPIAGVIADRVNQRLLLFATQAVALVSSLCLAILIATGAVELWHIYAQVLIQASITAFDAVARQALFPRLIPKTVLPQAVTLSITAARVSKFIGPALGGLLIADLGLSSPFFVNAASFLGLMAALAWMRPTPYSAAGTATSFRSEMAEGLRHILSAPVLSGILKLEIVFSLFEMNPAMIAIIGREILDVGPRGMGLLLAAPALGSLVAISWLLYAKRIGRQGRLSLSSTLAYAFVLVLLVVSPSYVFSLIALACLGMLEVLLTVTRSTVMQLAAPEHMRGRVMANVATVSRGVGPLAETQSGFTASLLGPSVSVLLAAGVVGLAAGLTAIFNRELWRFSFDRDRASSD